MFMAADLVIINKADLLPYVDFDVDACLRQARQLNPGVEMLTVSATTGEGLDGWFELDPESVRNSCGIPRYRRRNSIGCPSDALRCTNWGPLPAGSKGGNDAYCYSSAG